MDKFFGLKARGTNVRAEIFAGLTTFFAMAYIVVANPNQITGNSVEGDLGRIWNAVYIASLLVAVIGTLLMAFYARMPFAQACGMGLNSFFFLSFVAPAVGTGGEIDAYQAGVVIIFISGLVFLFLTVTGLRTKVAKALPDCLKKAIPAGIGLFIAFVGFQNVGLIQKHDYTLVQFVDISGALKNGAFMEVALPAMLSLLGLLLIGVLEKFKIKGSVLITIISVTVLNYLLRWELPNFNFSQIGGAFKDFGEIGITGVFQAQSWKDAFTSEAIGGVFSAIMLIITFCLVDMFDTVGTLYGAASQANLLDQNGDPINVEQCMTCDSIGTLTGAVLGTSTCTTFAESAAGVAAGGRTGLTSVVTALCFALCLVLTPLASIVPACATAPALIYVGVLMLKSFSDVDMKDMRSAIPAFLALIMMPLTYSISNGIGIGAIAYVVLSLCTGKYKKSDITVTIIAVLFAMKFLLITI